jgi:hypothetical protein
LKNILAATLEHQCERLRSCGGAEYNGAAAAETTDLLLKETLSRWKQCKRPDREFRTTPPRSIVIRGKRRLTMPRYGGLGAGRFDL